MEASVDTRKAARLPGTGVRSKVGALYRSIAHAGNRYACPCCGGRFRSFIAFNGRPLAQCPRCLSLERHRLMWLFLQHPDQASFLEPGARVLEVAPRRCLADRLQDRLGSRYITGDLVAPAVDVRLDLQSIPFLDGTFDLIVASHVIGYVPDDSAAFAECRRALKPTGAAIILTPFHPTREDTIEGEESTDAEWARLGRPGRKYGVRFYSRADFLARLERAGFHVHLIPYGRQLGTEALTRYRLDADEEIVLCSKMPVSGPAEPSPATIHRP